MKNTIRTISIVSYLIIILAGQMIGLPLIIWLFFTVLDFGNIDQLFAIFGLAGIILNLTKWRNNVPVTILSFLFMLSPIISRLVQVPIEMFKYLAFLLPLTIFILTYLTLIILTQKKNHSRHRHL